MRRPGPTGVALSTLIALLLSVPMVGSAGEPAAAAARNCNSNKAPLSVGSAYFYGVGALSSCSAWAVGSGPGGTLVEHWNGKAWARQTSANVIRNGTAVGTWLTDVVATSPTQQWATGEYTDPGNSLGYQSMIERRSGTTAKWKVAFESPLTHTNFLMAIDAASGQDVWAVGDYYNGSNSYPLPLVEHWDGHKWRFQSPPAPGSGGIFERVDARSANDVWAAGWFFRNTVEQTLIEHWNGKSWKVVPSPNAIGTHNNNDLLGIAMRSATDGWAVGDFRNQNDAAQTLILHWNGSNWARVNSPNPAGAKYNHQLSAVMAISANNAWAVGQYSDANHPYGRPLIEHWDGHSWKVHPIAVPAGPSGNGLVDVAETSADAGWATGNHAAGAYARRCC